ncbi:MAG: hypothetical protein QXF26_00720 [Candidatus Bathyarchaeia archaeon]
MLNAIISEHCDLVLLELEPRRAFNDSPRVAVEKTEITRAKGTGLAYAKKDNRMPETNKITDDARK